MKILKEWSFADLLTLLVPVALIVPNLYICLLDSSPFEEWIASVLLPLGIYLMLIAISKNTPRTTVLSFPLMLIVAFQIVVSYLYHDGSPIGADMFLNVRTTNVTEVNELLSSICLPVIVVVACYLPLLIAAMVAWRYHTEIDVKRKKSILKAGISISAIGVLACVYCKASQPSYRVTTRIFPVNALYNLKEAVERQQRMSNYADTSHDFTYEAKSDRGAVPELYIAVIGETSRADNWQLFGYNRKTNPRLSLYGDSVIAFRYVFSESNTTHKSVPMLLNTLSSEDFDENIYRHRSIITAFKEAGFFTSFISVQKPNNSIIEYYAKESDSVTFLSGKRNLPALDEEVIPLIDSIISDGCHKKKLVVIHTYGSHYDYVDRYPSHFAVFNSDKHLQANSKNRSELLDAYDNTIVYTDYVLSELIARTNAASCDAALIYTSDHGEDLYDDESRKFLHASPVPTYWQLHVPFLIYMNQSYATSHPDLRKNALQNSDRLTSSSLSFAQTLLDLAGVNSRYNKMSQSLVSREYEPVKNLNYLNELNESVDLNEWGFDDYDKQKVKDLLDINHPHER
jgi:glucan phosphoethanolaminetransferase (alkaline phosphatase superfamily)